MYQALLIAWIQFVLANSFTNLDFVFIIGLIAVCLIPFEVITILQSNIPEKARQFVISVELLHQSSTKH